jgi:uncharacterized protein (TIGR03437 family)
LLGAASSVHGQVNVLTYHNDLARTGQNLNETILNPANVNPDQFGKLFSYPVDGQVYAQPLYAWGLTLPGKGTHNVVFVATEHDSVYAFDADGGGILWQVSFIDPSKSIVPVFAPEYTSCGVVTPEVGITGTPVIDLAARTLYVVVSTLESQPDRASPYIQRLHALDIATGAERAGSPVLIQATFPGNADDTASVAFKPDFQLQRAGLVLWNGVVYIAWSSYCDRPKYHGWVIGYDARTLQQVAVYNSTANGNGGSFWTSGAAPAVDQDGNMYLIAGNGIFDGHQGGSNLGNTFIKLATAEQLSVLDYFAPFNVFSLNGLDTDLGSSGAMLLPDEVGSPAHPHLLVSAGKEGRIYVLDRDNMGHYRQDGDDQIVQSLAGAIQPLFGIPSYFNKTVYFAPIHDALKAFAVSNGLLSATPTSQSTTKFGFPGAVTDVSANGSQNGILWLLEAGFRLHAYDAADLSKELYNSGMRPDRDDLGSYVKFSTPTIANGKVYVGTQNSLVAYGLLAPPSIGMVASSAGFQTGPLAPGSLVSVFGTNLAAGTEDASQSPLPLSLGGAKLLINGNPAPLLYASPGQLNAQIPCETPLGSAVMVVVTGNTSSVPVRIVIQQTAPGLFAATMNQDGSTNGPDHPAAPGTYLSAFLTGMGPSDPPMATGVPAPAGPLARAMLPVTAFIGTQSVHIQFAGLAPGLVGIFQVNIMVPALPPGSYPLGIMAGGAATGVTAVQIGGSVPPPAASNK